MAYIHEEFARKFLGRIGPPDERGCRLWLGSKCKGGYGQVKQNRVQRLVTHVALEFYDGQPVDPGTKVLHSCDNPPCCEGSHLRRGTHAENMAEMVAKGRQSRGCTHSSRLHPELVPRGEHHGRAILTEPAVVDILHRANAGETTNSLAMEYGVQRQQILRIINGTSWAWLPRVHPPRAGRVFRRNAAPDRIGIVGGP